MGAGGMMGGPGGGMPPVGGPAPGMPGAPQPEVPNMQEM